MSLNRATSAFLLSSTLALALPAQSGDLAKAGTGSKDAVTANETDTAPTGAAVSDAATALDLDKAWIRIVSVPASDAATANDLDSISTPAGSHSVPGDEVVPYRSYAYEITSSTVDLAFVLASPSSGMMPGDTLLPPMLADTVVLWADVRPICGSLIPIPGPLPPGADLYLQPIAVKFTPALTIDAAPVLHVTPDDRDVAGEGEKQEPWSEERIEEMFAMAKESLTLDPMVTESLPPLFGLYAEFTGRTDGYGLWVSHRSTDKGRVQVFLTLKVPGKGEGHLDVVETHGLHVDLGFESQFEVLVAITDGRQTTEFRLMESFDL